MDIKLIGSIFKELKPDQSKRFFKFAGNLFDQFSSSLILEEPYKLLLDSNILMRLEAYPRNVIAENLLAIFFFFDFFKYQKQFKASIIIRPSTFFEYFRKEPFENELDHWNKFNKLRATIEESLGLDVKFEMLSSFQEASASVKNIEADISSITQALKEIERKSWNFELVRDFGGFHGFPTKDGRLVTTPHFAAQELTPHIKTKYFSENSVRMCLADHIAWKISSNPHNNQAVIKKYTRPDQFKFRKVLKLNSNGILLGIGDLDFISLCAIPNQFKMQELGNYSPSYISLSLDEDLMGAIYDSTLAIVNTRFIVGENKDKINMAFEKSAYERKRILRSQNNIQLFHDIKHEYFKSIDQYFSPETE